MVPGPGLVAFGLGAREALVPGGGVLGSGDRPQARWTQRGVEAVAEQQEAFGRPAEDALVTTAQVERARRDGHPREQMLQWGWWAEVSDAAFTATSELGTHRAACARLHHPTGWLPEWELSQLEVDLGKNVRLVGLALQGGFLGTVSLRPGDDDPAVDDTLEWTQCAYVTPSREDLEGIQDVAFPSTVARKVRFEAERILGESGLRFEVFVTDAPEGVEPLTEQERVVSCTACGKKICVLCMVEDHAGLTCEAFARWKEENESGDRAYADMVAEGLIKPCPNCNSPILKNEGCNYMTCPTCNDPNGMCWQTGKKRYGPDGCGGGHNCH